LEYIDISSVIDFGFGLGHLFESILKEFLPFKAEGIEPSSFAFEKVKERKIKPVMSTKLALFNIDLVTWAKKQNLKQKYFDLGICTSVFQYLSDDELEFIIPIMAQKVKYLYLTVPTNKELDRQIEELKFEDKYAIRRSKTKYQKILREHFTFVGRRLLESKYHFDEETTFFTDLLFRF